jgi:hypothetical protein
MAELFAELPVEARSVTAAAWVRRGVMALFALLAAAGVANLAGQHATVSIAATADATVRVRAPERVRGGLFLQTRIDIDAKRGFERPRLIFDRGVFEGMQVSSIEPAVSSSATRR